MDQQVFNQTSSITPGETLSSSTNTAISYAGFWRRFLAALIDGIFMGILSGLLGFAFGSDFIIGYALNLIVGVIYVGVFDSSMLMGTPGKALVGIVVVRDSNYEKLSFKTAVIRYLLKSLSALILFIGYLIQPFTRKRQTLHDLITETVVIRKDIGDINYFKAFKENFRAIIN